jgi:hypothetical protein
MQHRISEDQQLLAWAFPERTRTSMLLTITHTDGSQTIFYNVANANMTAHWLEVVNVDGTTTALPNSLIKKVEQLGLIMP